MNILINKLPRTVQIGGIEILINTDFRTSIEFEELIKNYDLEDDEQRKEFWDNALKLYYPILNIDFNESTIEEKNLFNYVIDNVGEAINQIMWFYRCGNECIKNTENQKTSKEEIYNFIYDEPTIFASLMQQYGINIRQENLHWWDFKAYFDNLNEDTEMRKIMSIRATDLSKIKDKDMKEYYRKLKRAHKIPLPEDEEGVDSKELEILMHGGNFSKLNK
ncbi:Gp15 family bacteriophage protein [Clostridium beijerinckii]|uniref:Gp15 family bacteriophage protein n=1 Tax=Clostridium beijerinckii TaxID=1520 RepID=UPI001F30EA9D|nr:Gp15 family bacteriophage protein [Clostridium beijerinckii]